MYKKVTAGILSAALAAVLLAGCAPKGNASGQIAEAGDSAEAAGQKEVYVFVAASLKNVMEDIRTAYEQEHPDVRIIYSADSSGALQTQIQEGARCDVFFSAAVKQMDALTEEGFVVEDSVTNLLENQIVLIKPKGEETAVTGFSDITAASGIALAGESVPAGRYARKLFENMGILKEVMEREINECANVTAVLTAVAEGSNEVGVVYKTDALSMPDSVEVIEEAPPDQAEPAVYPVGLIRDEEASDQEVLAAEEFRNYLAQDPYPARMFTEAGFRVTAGAAVP